MQVQKFDSGSLSIPNNNCAQQFRVEFASSHSESCARFTGSQAWCYRRQMSPLHGRTVGLAERSIMPQKAGIVRLQRLCNTTWRSSRQRRREIQCTVLPAGKGFSQCALHCAESFARFAVLSIDGRQIARCSAVMGQYNVATGVVVLADVMIQTAPTNSAAAQSTVQNLLMSAPGASQDLSGRLIIAATLTAVAVGSYLLREKTRKQ